MLLGNRHRKHAQDDGKAGDEAEVDIELVEVLVHGGRAFHYLVSYCETL